MALAYTSQSMIFFIIIVILWNTAQVSRTTSLCVCTVIQCVVGLTAKMTPTPMLNEKINGKNIFSACRWSVSLCAQRSVESLDFISIASKPKITFFSIFFFASIFYNRVNINNSQPKKNKIISGDDLGWILLILIRTMPFRQPHRASSQYHHHKVIIVNINIYMR